MAIAVESVEQISLNAVRVTFTEAPERFNQNATNDSLNTQNYLLNTGSPYVQHVAPGDNEFEVVVYFDQALVAGSSLELEIDNIDDDTGTSTVPFTSVAFVAFGAEARAEVPDAGRAGRFDIANPQTVRDSNGGPLGTFPVTETGDLGNDTGRANLRKRVFRRITTRPGGFFHLQNYGVRQEMKTLLTPTRLRELQVDLESQVSREPDVVAARVRVSELAPGVVRVRVRVQDALGPFEIEGSLDLNGDS